MPNLGYELSLLEMVVRHGERASVSHLSGILDDFVRHSRSFAARRGIDVHAISAIERRVGTLVLALQVGNRIRIRVARNDALRAIRQLQTESSLLTSEAWENNLPIWLF
jgi:hypothetical protein